VILKLCALYISHVSPRSAQINFPTHSFVLNLVTLYLPNLVAIAFNLLSLHIYVTTQILDVAWSLMCIANTNVQEQILSEHGVCGPTT